MCRDHICAENHDSYVQRPQKVATDTLTLRLLNGARVFFFMVPNLARIAP